MTGSTGFSQAAGEVGHMLATRPLIRTINFHNTARERTHIFEQQLAHCSRHFATPTEDDLDRYLSTGRWDKPRPGMILAFYEGYRNNCDVILPLLERYGLVGWFFVITGFVDCPVDAQLDYLEPHGIGMSTREYSDGRYAMTWDELREIDRIHVVASHALSHLSIAEMDEAAQRAEIIGSQESFKVHLGHPVRTFVSRGAPPYGQHPPSDALIDEAGYQFVVSGYKIQRLRSWHPVDRRE
jgi:peptidoglycan/xylan/chitin deacetylase (PgdA/CDA1 family)